MQAEKGAILSHFNEGRLIVERTQPRLRDGFHFALLLERLNDSGGPTESESGGEAVGPEQRAADSGHVEWRACLHPHAVEGGRGEIPIDAEFLFIAQGDLNDARLDFDLLRDPAIHQLNEGADGLMPFDRRSDLRDPAEAVEHKAVAFLQHGPQLCLQGCPKGVLVFLRNGHLGCVGRGVAVREVLLLPASLNPAGISPAAAGGAAERDRRAARAAAGELGIVDGVEDALALAHDDARSRDLEKETGRFEEGGECGAQRAAAKVDGDLTRDP